MYGVYEIRILDSFLRTGFFNKSVRVLKRLSEYQTETSWT